MSETKKRLSRRLKQMTVEMEEPDGSVKDYTIKAIDSLQRDQFMACRDKYFDKGEIKPGMMGALMSELITLTLYDPNGQLVTIEFSQSLPQETQVELFKEAIRISDLDEEAKKRAKNDSPASGNSGTAAPNV